MHSLFLYSEAVNILEKQLDEWHADGLLPYNPLVSMIYRSSYQRKDSG